MCTTYVGLVLVKRLLSAGVTFTDYPQLIRLDPNIPYKTRGNGAIALRFHTDVSLSRIAALAKKTVEELSVFSDPQTNPGIALFQGAIPHALHAFYERALHRLLTVEDALTAADDTGAILHGYKNRRGVIGALAAIGEELKGDHTYELLAYRKKERWGTHRCIDATSVMKMDQQIKDTFFNYDYEEQSLCIAPHSVCPVLLGIRGESASSVLNALSVVNPGEPISSYVIFRTNQHTNFHFEHVPSVKAIVDYSSVICEGTVEKDPWIIAGGHVFFQLENGGSITCAAFEPTKTFREVIRCLKKGDRVRVYGGVKPASAEKKWRAINVERIDILDVVTTSLENPRCPHCHISMTSKGRHQGYACRKCGFQKKKKESVSITRRIDPGSYEPPPSAWRHLYRFLSRERVNAGNDISLIDSWIT
jgi:tRNA(Ile2)-agmatinylcytidine synthase